MKKILLTVLFSVIFMSLNHTSIGALEVTPEKFIVQDHDFGRYYTLNLKNTEDEAVTLTLEEILTTLDNTNIVISNTKTEQKFLEIGKSEITIDKSSEYPLEVRFKFAENKSINQFPALSIKDKSTQQEIIVPFLAQCNKCEFGLENTIEKNNTTIIFDKSFEINGQIQNTGGKFVNVKGDITVIKNGNIVKETVLNDQISGILFPKNSKNYTYTYTHSDNILESIGSYTVESRIYNDINGLVNGTRITYIYVPIELIIIIVSLILLITFVTIVLKLRRKKSVK